MEYPTILLDIDSWPGKIWMFHGYVGLPEGTACLKWFTPRFGRNMSGTCPKPSSVANQNISNPLSRIFQHGQGHFLTCRGRGNIQNDVGGKLPKWTWIAWRGRNLQVWHDQWSTLNSYQKWPCIACQTNTLGLVPTAAGGENPPVLQLELRMATVKPMSNLKIWARRLPSHGRMLTGTDKYFKKSWLFNVFPLLYPKNKA